ncbi:E3 ubiquitin-protein ligase TRIP12 [Dirofilaria immitis]|nr:E3 ubiquitin-protein ligase TRIP12 [Dirofilaria immitis]
MSLRFLEYVEWKGQDCKRNSSMSNIGSASGQHGDNATLPQVSRKRSSPNSGSLKSEASPTTSVAAVGSSSSKLRRVIHSSVEQNPESNDLSRQQNSQLPGTSETGSVGGGSGRSSSGRSGHESIRSELKYLTDFFPDQNPSGRRLTRSQRQYSIPVSNSQTTDSIDSSAHTNSGSSLVEQPRSAKDKPRTRKGRASVAGRVTTGTESSRTVNNSEQQPSTSSSARTRAHSSATGLCHSIARCESTANRVSPAFVQQGESSGCRSTPQLGVVVQDIADNASANTVTVSNSATLTTPVNNSAATTTTNTELSRAVHGDANAAESHSSQFRNLQRSQAVHTASSFLGALVPRVQHLLGSAHSHPSIRNIAEGHVNDSLGLGNSWQGIAYNFSPRFDFPAFTVTVKLEHLGSDNIFQNMWTRGLRHGFIQPVGAGADSDGHRSIEIIRYGRGFLQLEGSN